MLPKTWLVWVLAWATVVVMAVLAYQLGRFVVPYVKAHRDAKRVVRRQLARITHHEWERTEAQRREICAGIIRSLQPWVKGHKELRSNYQFGWFAGPVLVRSQFAPPAGGRVWHTPDGQVHVAPAGEDAVILEMASVGGTPRMQRFLTLEESVALGASLQRMGEAGLVRRNAVGGAT